MGDFHRERCKSVFARQKKILQKFNRGYGRFLFFNLFTGGVFHICLCLTSDPEPH